MNLIVLLIVWKTVLAFCYKTSPINCHCRTQVFDAVCNFTARLAFDRHQPLKTKTNKIRQGTNNKGKWKESRMHKEKQMLIFLNKVPD